MLLETVTIWGVAALGFEKTERGYEGMNKEELSELINLRREISELETAIIHLRQQRPESVTDKVRASGKEYPYINGFKQISGINVVAEERRKKQLAKKEALLKQRKEKAEETELKIMEYINSVQDSRIRIIMQCRFIDGYRWEKIGKLLNCDRTYPKKLIDRYLKNF